MNICPTCGLVDPLDAAPETECSNCGNPNVTEEVKTLIAKLEGPKVDVVNLHDGDLVVIHNGSALPLEQAARFRTNLKAQYPDLKIEVVLLGDTRLSVIHKE